METQHITLDRTQARELYRKYRSHQHYSTPVDAEVQRTYQLIAQGHLVIKALESIAQAGLGDDHLPRLAIVRADAERCYVHMLMNGGARFQMKRWTRDVETRCYIDLPAGSFPGWDMPRGRRNAAEAMVPLVPIDQRPKRGLANYHILFEAEWSPIPPTDPMLLRRIGKADLWVVCAAWDLTEVERAVLAGRLNA